MTDLWQFDPDRTTRKDTPMFSVKQSDCRSGWYVADASGRPVPYTMVRRREVAAEMCAEMNAPKS